MNIAEVRQVLQRGQVIPAHPLALTESRRLDERRQRALTRYYMAAGAGGIAVGVHTTQFAIHDSPRGLLQPILELAAITALEASRPVVKIAGVSGSIRQAITEAEMAADLGYDAVLLSPLVPGAELPALLDRAQVVSEVLPVIGFYLQSAIGGPRLPLSFWREFVAIPDVVAIKAAPFNRYATIDVARAVAESGRTQDISLYTGNDDNIVYDLIGRFAFGQDDVGVAGGLLGQWAVWTKSAVDMLSDIEQARAGDTDLLVKWLNRANCITDANAAVFDSANDFRGCIPGIHQVLYQQGLLGGIWCLDPDEVLSAGQLDEISRVSESYPWLTDDSFVAEHLDEWLT